MASLLELLGQTWPARLAQSAWSAAKLPGDVYAGRVDPLSDEGIGRAADLGGLVMGGTYAGAPRGVLGSGPTRPALPMDEASRMARAAEQGYTVDAYRGEGKALTGDEYVVGHPHRYDPGFLGGDAIYSTNTPRLANDYAMLKAAKEIEPAQNVVPLKLKMENPKVITGEEKKRISGLDRFERDDWLRDVFDQGHDGVIVQYGGGDKTKRSSTYEEYVARPENYRSRFAKFDPKDIGKSGLMLGGAGAAVLSATADKEDKPKLRIGNKSYEM
jgi:hypothetical protein